MTLHCMWRPHPKGRPPPSIHFLVLLLMFISSVEATLRFTSQLYNGSVPENAHGNTAVVSDVKMGMFVDEQAADDIRYKIIAGDPENLFKTSARVVGNFCFLEIRVKTGNRKVLNRESRVSYLLEVKAQRRKYDKSKEDIPGVATQIYIKITDLNDLTPLFLDPTYSCKLSEDTAIYSSVIKVKAEDPDAGLNGEVYYSFQNPSSVFAIHPKTGVVTLTRSLSQSKQPHYELKIIARDRGIQLLGAYPSTALLTVNVTAINQFEPRIEITKLSETLVSGHLNINAIITVVDKDRGPSGQVKSLEIKDDQDKIFRIVSGSSPNEFQLASLNTLKWEDFPNGFNISLKVTDNGARPRFSNKPVRIAAPPMPLQEPIFTEKEYEVEIIESAPPGSKVAGVSTWLPGTQTQISFSIIAGNEGGHFSIDPKSGILFTAHSLDADTKDEYSIIISATTSGIFSDKQQNNAKVIIKITDANDFTPMIVAPQGVVTVEEHQPPGSWVTQVRAQDFDTGENKHVSYSIANVEDVPFVIDHFTGEIKTNQVLDYETEKRLWKLKVRASDWGTPFRRQSEKIILVKVLDVNDNRPQFESTDCTGTLDRSTPIGTEVFTLSALDFDEGNIIYYRIMAGNKDRCFSLESQSGVLTLTCDLQDDLTNSIRITNVTATDGQHFADTMTIQLTLTNQRSSSGSWIDINCQRMGIAQKMQKQLALSNQNNPKEDDNNFRLMTPAPPPNEHAPEVLNSRVDRPIRVRENSDVGTIVYNIEAQDIDEGYDGYLMYVISEGNTGSVFDIGMTTGEISVAGLLDREFIARYNLNVTIYDLGNPRRSASQEVVITLVDENDNEPNFEKAAYSFYLPETVGNGTSVSQLIAYDPDEGRNGAITYHLDTDTQDFYLDPVNGRLSVSRPLDYEKIDMYELRVVASDGKGRSSYAYVTIELVNMNDCAPEFPEGPSTIVRVPEDIPTGALLAFITANDEDSTDLHYSMKMTDHFQLDQRTAALRLIKPLDYETQSSYNISIYVSDQGQPSLSGQTNVIIQVVDVNENIHAPVFGHDVLRAKIPENVPPNSYIASAPARDGDLSQNPSDAQITYSLLGDQYQGFFYIDQQGDIYTAVSLDRETKSHYWLTVRATDSGTVPLHATLHVYLEVEDVNDNRPLSQWPAYWPAVMENSPPDTPVSTVQATDPDAGYSDLTFSIVAGNPQSFFRINPKSGEILTTERRLDREHSDEHQLEVLITDGNDPTTTLSSTTYVFIVVSDENDNAPEFLERILKISVPVSPTIRVGSIAEPLGIGQVVAKDLDAGSNGEITYTIEGDDWLELFRIDPKTGTLFAIAPLDPNEIFKLTIQAYDNGLPIRRTSCLVTITPVQVGPESPSPPRLLGGQKLSATMLENEPVGHLVHFVQADDEDGDQLWFDIIGGNDDNLFTIGRDTGNILVAKRADAEKKAAHNLTISVTDGVHVVTCTINITVMDVNDNRPMFSLQNYDVEIGENTSPGTTILTLSASDKDEDKVLSYFLANTAHVSSESKFSVDSTNGDIIVKELLDREVQNVHMLTVGVKDRLSPVKKNFARVTISVRDYNDHPPEFLQDSYQGVVTETMALGSSILQTSAIDRDRGPNAHLTYSIISGNIGGTFSIDPESGVLSLSREVSIVRMPEYWLSIKASDDGSPSKYSHTNIKILVKMDQDSSPRFSEDEYLFEISESARVGTQLGSLATHSHLGVVFSMVAQTNTGPFVINPSSGELRLNQPLDFEKEQSYFKNILATSMNGKEATVKVVVNVLDENDNAPEFVRTVYEGLISEAAPLDSVVLVKDNQPLVILAQDRDSEQNSNLVYSIVDEEARQYFKIDPSTGAIRTNAKLDHEVLAHINFSVSVHDNGRPRLSAHTKAKVSVQITDINDVTPRFLKNEYRAKVMLPTHKDVSVLEVKAIDLDFDGKANLLYDIVAGNGESEFSIERETGRIYINNSAEMKETYKLKVTVTDGQFSSSTSVYISCESLLTNHFGDGRSGLRFAREKYFASVEENSTSVQSIVMVNVLGSEINEHLVFEILNPEGFFEIRRTSGVIRTTGIPMDREQKENYVIIVQARSTKMSLPLRVAQVAVHVVVVDKNDNAPIFVNTPYYGVVTIDSKKDEIIFKVQATDFDSGENSRVRYEFQRGNGELFSVKRSTGEIILRQSLQGVATNHVFIISAYDGGAPPLLSQVEVRLKVVDRSQPIFDKQFYGATVSETASLYTPVITMEAKSQLNRKIFYTLVDGNDAQMFAMQYEEGVITVSDELDFEKKPSYQLKVRAIDSFTGKYAEVALAIQLVDSNDNPPEFVQPYYNVSVSEATAVASPILKLMTTDADSGSNAGVSYQLKGLSDALPPNFYMESSSGMLYLKKALDREFEPFHEFLVVATDMGTPPLSSTAQVYITVLDMNDNAPEFSQPSFRCGVSEGSSRGQFVSLVSASDKDDSDQENLMYSIISGNDLQTFSIEANTGIMTVWNPHRLRETSETLLNISVTDGVFTSYTRLAIATMPLNSNSPVFQSRTYKTKIKENNEPETYLLTVKANDEDAGRYGDITYHFVGDEATNYFRINENTGKILSVKSFDRETRAFYSFTVMAVDMGGRSGFTQFEVKVQDENDNSPQFTRSNFKGLIYSNKTIGNPLIKITATDVDAGVNAEIHYTFHESTSEQAKKYLEIEESTGIVRLRVDTMRINSLTKWKFLAVAHDNGNPVLHSNVPVVIQMLDKNTALPRFLSHEYNFAVKENISVGTRIDAVTARYGGPLKYAIDWPPQEKNRPVAITPDGILTVQSLLDYERQSRITITVNAISKNQPELVVSTIVTIEVQDINDEEPMFESDKYYISVAENTPIGSNIIKVHASDKDSGRNGKIRYLLEETFPLEQDPIFALDPYTGWLTLNRQLDFEMKEKYQLMVIATDNGTPALSSTTMILLEVIDYNDNPPTFSKSDYQCSVKEDALPGTVIVELKVEDIDSPSDSSVEESNPFSYYIVEGNWKRRFHIRRGGQIYVAAGLDREVQDHYELTVVLTDGLFVSKTNVHVNIQDVNDNAPMCTHPLYAHRILEDAPPGTLLVKVRAFDADLIAPPQFYLSGEGSDVFKMDVNTGQLRVDKRLDRETQNRYELKATVRDGENAKWQCKSSVHIDVGDVNDNAPKFSQDTYSINVPENSPNSLLLMKIHASDPDLGQNRKVSYSLKGSNKFTIDRSTGILSTTKSLDREKHAMYNLTVTAHDRGHNRMSSSTNILVLVSDVNDNPPEFTSHTYSTIIMESSNIGFNIIRVLATSRDSGKNAEISYSIIGGNEHRKFNIHHKTGVVSISNHLDFERGSRYLLTIQAKDGGYPPLTNHATVNVTVIDINDNRPVFIQNSYSAIVNEAAHSHEKLIQVVATDLDSGKNGELTYAIAGGDPHQQFHVDKYDGWISVVRPLDRERISSYELDILALDKGVPELSGTVSVYIEVRDANDNPPVFVAANNTAYVQEDKLPGHLVFHFEVSDADSDDARNGAPFDFRIVEGNVNMAFSIDREGRLRTNKIFNHIEKDLYKLKITVYDNGRPPLETHTWISVKIIEESQFAPTVYPLRVMAFIRPENYKGGIMGKLQASDNDPYDSLTFNIVKSHRNYNHKYFNVDAKSGYVSSTSPLNEGTYTLNISVSDGKFTTFERVDIDLIEISDKMVAAATIIQLKGASPEEFLLSFRRAFHRSMKNIFSVKSKDIVIMSIQNPKDKRYKREKTIPLYPTFKEGLLDIMFAVKKNSDKFYPRSYVRRKLLSERKTLEGTLGLSVVDIPRDKCIGSRCTNGRCRENIAFENEQVQVATPDTEALSFVAPLHRHESICICPPGYSGRLCEIVVNKCAHQPCSAYQICIPQQSELGYMCVCPNAYVGATCSMNKSQCLGRETSPECYSPVFPVSLKGQDVFKYEIRIPIERHLSFSMWIRTLYPSGNLIFMAGRLDYSILEVNSGHLRFRWDLGSGEGIVTVTSLRVDDGLWHHVAVERLGSLVFLRVDGKYKAEGSSPGSTEILNLGTPHLHLGAEMHFQTLRHGYVGCIDDPRVDNSPLQLTNRNPSNSAAYLLDHSNVTLHCYGPLQAPGLCGTHPCLNGGMCEERDSSFICECGSRFRGAQCEIDTNPCASSPCINGGRCVNDGNTFRCECPAQVSGVRCQHLHCNPNPCLNKGICEEGTNGPICKCRGFTGTYCNVDLDECEKNPCEHGGSCINTYGGFKCMCPSNLTGIYCDIPTTITAFPIGIEEIIYIVIGIVIIICCSLMMILAMHCRDRHRTRHRRRMEQNHVALNCKTTNTYNKHSKMSNIQASQM